MGSPQYRWRENFFLEAPPRFELGHQDFADPCLTTWLWRRFLALFYVRYPLFITEYFSNQKNTSSDVFFWFGASDEARTRYLHLGKVALYQMSYTRISERKMRSVVPPAGIEPATRGFSVPCSTN